MRLIDADAAIESLTEYGNGRAVYIGVEEAVRRIEQLPSAQSETNCSEIPNNSDTISRQAAIDKFIDELEEIFSDIREREVDDSVCGLCEYDGAYIGQSGDWCNECPGFDRDDCFKLSDKTRKEWTDEIIKALPSVQPEQRWVPCSERLPEEETDVLVTRKFLGCRDGSHGWNNHIPPTTYVEVAQYFNGEWTALLSAHDVVCRNRKAEQG